MEDKETLLCKLFNEFMDDEQEWLYAYTSYDEEFIPFFHTEDGEVSLEPEVITGKRFGFIKWLWENDYLKEYEAVYSPLDGRWIYIGDYCIPTINDSLVDSIISYLATHDDQLRILSDLIG